MVFLSLSLAAQHFAFGDLVVEIPPATSLFGSSPGVISHFLGESQRIKALCLHAAMDEPLGFLGRLEALSPGMQWLSINKL